MKIEFEHDKLSTAVNSLKNCVGGSDFVEADNLLFETIAGDKIKLMATDTVNFAARYVECKYLTRGASRIKKFFINYRILSQYLSVWSDKVNLSVSDKGVIIQSGKDIVKLPQLQGIEEFLEKFPKMAVSKKSVYAKGVYTYLSLCASVSPKEHNMPLVTGVHLMVNSGDMVIEAADGFQSLRFEKLVKPGINLDVVLYKTGCLLLVDLQQSGKLWIKDNWLFFRTVDGLYALSTLDGGVGGVSYPDLVSVIPIGGNKVNKVQFNTAEFKDVLQKASLLGCNNVVLKGLGLQEASVESVSVDSTSVYKARIDMHGKLPHISLDISQLLFALSLCNGETITFSFKGSGDAVKYENDEVLEGHVALTYVIMPYHV